ncbi:uncharacterized protein BDR25DRAFT_356164 [Lindgomyces ingoldianus]|uniref:Uncharacterized protein n=1 Tax=Lindgomyces ingoldianus TaxID=673940 RepID=A0ACB6QS94_9PLEO|nr:uncharacterized protein BDR25DRAFT_356164 [Lindgomyces ingoldianus]KAF2469894.1 hypothetical protein BDR25DRAFT_356164 [Lindgomyces ingoldianus]
MISYLDCPVARCLQTVTGDEIGESRDTSLTYDSARRVYSPPYDPAGSWAREEVDKERVRSDRSLSQRPPAKPCDHTVPVTTLGAALRSHYTCPGAPRDLRGSCPTGIGPSFLRGVGGSACSSGPTSGRNCNGTSKTTGPNAKSGNAIDTYRPCAKDIRKLPS